jgi:hypothetical protein
MNALDTPNGVHRPAEAEEATAVIMRGEELLERAQEVSHTIEEQVRRALDAAGGDVSASPALKETLP